MSNYSQEVPAVAYYTLSGLPVFNIKKDTSPWWHGVNCATFGWDADTAIRVFENTAYPMEDCDDFMNGYHYGQGSSPYRALVRNPRTPTVGDLRKAIADLSDKTPLLGVIGDHTTTIICVQRAVGPKGVVASLVLWDWDRNSNGYLGDITAERISDGQS